MERVMIIWGSKAKERVLMTGQFDCPQCEARRPYRHVTVHRYFTLYFIPLFSMEKLGEYVECGGCGTTFKVDVLSYRLPTHEDRMLRVARMELESGTPLEMTRRKLVNMGQSEETAERLVSRAAMPRQETCGGCGLTFLQGIRSCSGCGEPLGAVGVS